LIAKVNKIPASIADAIAEGIRCTNLASAGQKPVMVSKTPDRKKPPTACSNSSPKPAEAAKNAAPGVDQTIEIGILYR
jgi:hypothetical protein